MIQVTEPTRTARSQKAPERMRSITEPETIEAAVQENSRKAAQKTPLMRAHAALVSGSVASLTDGPPRCVPINSLQGSAFGASIRPRPW